MMTDSQISDYLTRVVQPKLQTVNGVANAEILGGQVFAMRIWLDPDRMASLGVTPLDVRAALASNNFTSAPGQVKGDFVQTNIDAKTSLETPDPLASSWCWPAGIRWSGWPTSPRSSSGRRARLPRRPSTA
jgi:multidrug efflux pump